jgi:hypothetical protein
MCKGYRHHSRCIWLYIVALPYTLFRHISTHELVQAFKYPLISLSPRSDSYTLIDLALREFDAYWCLSYFLFCHCEKKKNEDEDEQTVTTLRKRAEEENSMRERESHVP